MRIYIVSYTTPEGKTYEQAYRDVCNAHAYADKIAHEFDPEMKADEFILWTDEDLYHSHGNANGYAIRMSIIEIYD